VVCCAAAAACSGPSDLKAGTPPSTVFVTISPVQAPPLGAQPVVYSIPQQIVRPLHLPQVQAGRRCPTVPERMVTVRNGTGGGFGGFSLGTVGPVHAIVGGPGGVGVAYRSGRWYSVKTLWYARRSYQGPVLIRGARLDGPGSVVFGEGHTLGFLADTGSPGHVVGVLRSWPGATWVRAPGCYGFQVDGTSFSYTLVLAIRAPLSN
jgi:hypothetical protein